MPPERARILVITGPGKGKTTAALGVLIRSLAYGRRALLTRFTKARHSGELDILNAFPNLTVLSGRYGMTPPAESPEFPKHAAAALELFERTREMAPDRDVLVMDEICGVVARNMVPEDAVVAFLAGLRGDQTAVLTGRGATPALIAAADTVSEILSLKHGFQHGIAAQEGVEF